MGNEKLVVLVDDDDELRNMLEHWVSEKGLNVKAFANGTDALNYMTVKENMDNVSLIVLDRILPDIDGMMILRKLVSQYGDDKAPVLILSTLKTKTDIGKGIKEGAINYIGKPFSKESFISKALKLLR